MVNLQIVQKIEEGTNRKVLSLEAVAGEGANADERFLAEKAKELLVDSLMEVLGGSEAVRDLKIERGARSE